MIIIIFTMAWSFYPTEVIVIVSCVVSSKVEFKFLLDFNALTD